MGRLVPGVPDAGPEVGDADEDVAGFGAEGWGRQLPTAWPERPSGGPRSRRQTVVEAGEPHLRLACRAYHLKGRRPGAHCRNPAGGDAPPGHPRGGRGRPSRHRQVSRPVLVECSLGGRKGPWPKASFPPSPRQRRTGLRVGNRGRRHDVSVLHQLADRGRSQPRPRTASPGCSCRGTASPAVLEHGLGDGTARQRWRRGLAPVGLPPDHCALPDTTRAWAHATSGGRSIGASVAIARPRSVTVTLTPERTRFK